MSVPAPAVSLREGLRALERAYTLGHHGPAVARRRAALVDACLVELFDHAGAPAHVALVATGGYGRMVQLPASDIDLLVVHDDAASIAVIVDALLYPLWDAGLPVGHAVRTAAECLAATERLDAWTAMLDGRLVAGDETLAARALAPVRARAREDPAGFARRLWDAASARRERFGSCAHLLEPDLKEGSGGLRDVASLGWLAAALGTDPEGAGVVRARERAAVDAGEAFLVRARSAIQLLTGRRTDRLVTELQPDVARGMGFVDEPNLLATDGLMRSLFEHARNVEHVSGLAVARMMAGATGGGSVDIGDPAAILEALADAADQGEVPSVGLLDAIEDVAVPDPVAWDARTRAAFLRLLRTGERGSAMFDVLDRMGVATSRELEGDSVGEPFGTLRVEAVSSLAGTVVPSDELPLVVDEIPILALVAAHARGESRFEGASELRVKESDRLAGLAGGIRELGGAAAVEGDALVVGGGGLRGGRTDARADHRLAMAFVVGALAAREPSEIEGLEWAGISFPGFASTLESLGARLEVEG